MLHVAGSVAPACPRCENISEVPPDIPSADYKLPQGRGSDGVGSAVYYTVRHLMLLRDSGTLCGIEMTFFMHWGTSWEEPPVHGNSNGDDSDNDDEDDSS